MGRHSPVEWSSFTALDFHMGSNGAMGDRTGTGTARATPLAPPARPTGTPRRSHEYDSAPASTSFSHRVMSKLDHPRSRLGSHDEPDGQPSHPRSDSAGCSISGMGEPEAAVDRGFGEGRDSKSAPSRAPAPVRHRALPWSDRYLGAQVVSGRAPHQAGVTHHVHRSQVYRPRGERQPERPGHPGFPSNHDRYRVLGVP